MSGPLPKAADGAEPEEAPVAPKPTRSGSQNRQRKRHIKVHLSEGEYAAVEDRANRSGLSLSSLARTALLGAEVPVTRRPPVEKKLLAQALGQLGKLGSNLNQIAHRTNQGREPLAELVEAELAELRVVRDTIMKALGRDH